ncbi:MAG: DUF4910 domain-containing protein, partial [Verrucomicrobiales bacterium]|nr:DUF4910 domain-containing protein [Verrucomicrobiales bacterium]
VRKTLKVLAENFEPELELKEVATGTQAFDWKIPKEWNIRDGWIADSNGEKIVDFKTRNLHVVGYSTPVNKKLPLEELRKRIHTMEDQPTVTPYVTSYYNDYWGFCMPHQQLGELEEGEYHVYIDSELKDGHLTYAEWVLPGESDEEIFLSAYVCHPSMANNELSGPLVATWIAKWLASRPRRFTYRIVFIPETIGSIYYLSRNLDAMKKRVVAGFNLSCVGDDRAYSYVASRYENTMADKVAKNVLASIDSDFQAYSFLRRGSDERQYCSPGVDLPIVTLCRTKFGQFLEYHTSADDFDRVVTPDGLKGGYEMVRRCIEAVEANKTYEVTCLCEPQMGRRNLRSKISARGFQTSFLPMMDLIAYCDGSNDLIDVSNLINRPVAELIPIVEVLLKEEILREVSSGSVNS